MVSILFIPEKKATKTTTVELRSSHTRQWLAKLPLLDAQDSLNSVFDALHEFNRIQANPGARLRLLELYRTPISFIASNIERLLSEAYCPLGVKHAKLAESCKQVTIEMAYGYKSVVHDLARGGRSKRPQDDLCTAIQRSIRYLTGTLYQCAVYYNSYPPSTWTEIHSLYRYACKLGIQEKYVHDVLNKAKPKNSVDHAYKQALLFGLSDVYRQPIATIGKIHGYLDRWASEAEIARYAKPKSNRCRFVVDPDRDRVGQPYSDDLAFKETKRLMLLDTRRITKTAHNHWQKLHSGTSPKHAGLGDDFFDDGALDMLERVVLAWGITPRRKYPRNAVSGPYEMGLGINASNYFLNGASSFKCVSTEGAVERHLATTGTFGLEQLRHRDENYVTQQWQGDNESIQGLCLSVDLSKPAAVQVRIGELIAFRVSRENAKWSAALIRWICITDAELRIGLQKLGAGAQAVAVKPVTPKVRTEEIFKNSIRLPSNHAIQQSQSLLTSPGMFKSQRNLFVDDGETLSMVRAKTLLEHGRYFEWFDYELLNI